MAEDQDNSVFDFVRYDPEVEAAIDEVFPSEDPMDKPDFDPVLFINTVFPSEQSLVNLDTFVSKLRVKVKHFDDDIQNSIRNQTRAGHDGRQALQDAQNGMTELFVHIRNIRAKAELSEKMVQEITRDIKALDIAKGHLTESISSLNHLHMLVGSIDRLNEMTRQGSYSEAAHLLSAVVDVLDHFSKHTDIDRIREFATKIDNIKSFMAQKINTEFRGAFPSAKPDPDRYQPALLLQACSVLDILDPSIKKGIVDWFLTLQLKDYFDQFPSQTEAAWVDKIDRRYAWFKKALQSYDDNCTSIFPPEWKMAAQFAVRFCDATREQLQGLLQVRKLELDLKMLMYSVRKTADFELFLNRRFNVVAEAEVQSPTPTELPPLPENASEADIVRHQYLQHKLNKQKKEQGAAAATAAAAPPKPTTDVVFTRKILSVFEAVLDVYITALDKQLTDMINDANKNFKSDLQKSLSGDEASETISSSSTLLQYIKDRFQDAGQFGSAKIYEELYRLFKRHLKTYGQKVLNPNLPRSTSLQGILIHNETIKLDNNEVVTVCRILNTAEYIIELTNQLQGKLQEKVDKDLKASIDLHEEIDCFQEVITNSIGLLVRSLECQCDLALQAMAKMRWDTIDEVGDASPYVGALSRVITTVVPHVRASMSHSRKYFNNFCLKFANSFIPRILGTLFKLRNISAVGAEQLLLDFQSMKPLIMDLPVVGSESLKQNPASYTRLVLNGMTKAEKIVKLLMSPHEVARLFVDDFVKLIGPAVDESDFVRVLEMKGLKRAEQQPLLDAFHAVQGAQPKEGGGLASSLKPARMSASSLTSSAGELGGVHSVLTDAVQGVQGTMKMLEKLVKKK